MWAIDAPASLVATVFDSGLKQLQLFVGGVGAESVRTSFTLLQKPEGGDDISLHVSTTWCVTISKGN
jgi:hypothetical protein